MFTRITPGWTGTLKQSLWNNCSWLFCWPDAFLLPN